MGREVATRRIVGHSAQEIGLRCLHVMCVERPSRQLEGNTLVQVIKKVGRGKAASQNNSP